MLKLRPELERGCAPDWLSSSPLQQCFVYNLPLAAISQMLLHSSQALTSAVKLQESPASREGCNDVYVPAASVGHCPPGRAHRAGCFPRWPSAGVAPACCSACQRLQRPRICIALPWPLPPTDQAFAGVSLGPVHQALCVGRIVPGTELSWLDDPIFLMSTVKGIKHIAPNGS